MSMFDWVQNLPIFSAKVISFATFIAVVIWVWNLPKDYVYQGSSGDGKKYDLRIWATVLMVIQFVIYIIL
jgi:hypothetical protein